ncbi:mannosyltransferase (PIG-V) domain-containing protein [Ditylenchus destructor]|nr:mannosyltransferase (PIG-V) domain-containing protein [Ditylenchus destructor]
MTRARRLKERAPPPHFANNNAKNDIQRVLNAANDVKTWSTASDEVEEQSVMHESICSFDDQQDLVTEPKILSFLIKQLVFSRIFLLTFQFFINRIMKDHPTDAFKGIPQTEVNRRDQFVQNLFGGLSCWDARHFLHVAEFGYTWESTLAWFPLFPAILRVLGTCIQFIFGPMNLFSAMLLGGVILNNIIFVVNGILLFRLAYMLTGNLKEAIISVYVFCWNPASIFFSAVYTESLYTLFTFSAVLFLQHNPSDRIRQIIASFILSFAFLTRANGLANIGYIGFPLFLEVILRKTDADKVEFEDFNMNFILKALHRLSLFLLCFFIMALPLRLFGFAMEEKFCSNKAAYEEPRLKNFLQNSSFVLPGDVANLTWCNDDRDPSPLLPPYYAEVQEKYWGVSLFGHWQLRKFPFFLMAAPTLGFVFYGILDFISNAVNDSRRIEQILQDRRMLIPFAIHSAFIAFAGIFFYNVEVSMRLLFSSSPFLYIVIARIMSEQTPSVSVPDDLMEPFLLPFLSIYARVRLLHFMMLTYLLGFFFFGTTLHVNWLPFI